MKKLFVVLIAAMLVAGLAGKAAATAYFQDGDLIRVVYDTSTKVEVGTDLGTVSSILAGGSLTADSFKSYFTTGGVTDWANMNVAYFAFQNGTTPTVWAAGNTQLDTGKSKWSGAYGGWQVMQAPGPYNGSSSTIQTTTDNQSSYVTKMDGLLGNYITVGAVNYSLASLAGASNDGGMALYSIPASGANGNHPGSLTGITLYTNADGTTTTSPVPLPPAVLLLAPGLVGLYGLRRRLS